MRHSHARANALENNVVADKMVKGRRADLKPVGSVRDADITGPGRVGVWSKADSQTVFEEFRFDASWIRFNSPSARRP